MNIISKTRQLISRIHLAYVQRKILRGALEDLTNQGMLDRMAADKENV